MKHRPEGESSNYSTDWSREDDSTISHHENSSAMTDVIGAEDVSETIMIDDQAGQENVFEETPKKTGGSVTKILLGGLATVALIGGSVVGYQYFTDSSMDDEERVIETEESAEEKAPIEEEKTFETTTSFTEDKSEIEDKPEVEQKPQIEEKPVEEKQQPVFTPVVEKNNEAFLTLDGNIQKLDRRLSDIEVGLGGYASKSMELFTYLNEQNDLRKETQETTLARIADLEKRISELSVNNGGSNNNMPPEVTREEYLALVKEVELLKAKPCACDAKVETKAKDVAGSKKVAAEQKPVEKNYIRVKKPNVQTVEVKPQKVEKKQPATKSQAILRSITNGIAWVEFEGQDVYKTYKVGDTLMGKRIGVIDSNVGIFDVNGNKLLDVK